MRTVTMSVLLMSLAMGCGGDSSVQPRTPDDFPPTAVETFEAQTLTAERERLTINFATSFKDPEERSLTYSAESSDASVVMATMSGPVLTIVPLAEGSATVSVRATDPGGNSATINVSVTVNPPAHPDDDESYQAFPRLVVSAGRVEFFEMSAQGFGACIDIDPKKVYREGPEAAQYQFHHSRWQRQDEYGWTTIPGTVRSENRLCAYTPPEAGLYRMVGDVTIGEHTITGEYIEHDPYRYSSNVLNHR